MTLFVLPLLVLVGCLNTLPEAALRWLPETIATMPRIYGLHLLARGLLGKRPTMHHESCSSVQFLTTHSRSRVFSGFLFGGLAAGYIWMMEWLPGRSRAAATTWLNCAFAVVAIGLAGLSALLWHHYPAQLGRDGTWPILQVGPPAAVFPHLSPQSEAIRAILQEDSLYHRPDQEPCGVRRARPAQLLTLRGCLGWLCSSCAPCRWWCTRC